MISSTVRAIIPMMMLAAAGASHAKSPTNTWDSDVVENYLAPKKGATIQVPFMTNPEEKSRWYSTYRVKSGYKNVGDLDQAFLQLNARLRGKTYVTDELGIIGDFWFKAQENYARVDGNTTNHYDDLDEKLSWEQFRFGVEHDTLGALMYGKHAATWSFFAVDMGSQALYDTQADAGQKNAGKIMYKNQFDNNLFINASYDTDSGIYGADIGYQDVDLYNMTPNTIGLYASVHNGQPSILIGNKYITGNVDITKAGSKHDNSDTGFARADENLLTYSVAGFKNFESGYRLVGQAAYSEMNDDEDKDTIRKQGWAEGGLGFSATAGIQTIPANFTGLSYILYNTYDEISGFSVTPQLEYWFGSPNMRAWISYTWEEDDEDTTRIEFQWDF